MKFAQRIRERLRERAAAWARRRQGEDAQPLNLRARRLYILPTRAGIGFAALLFLMLLAGLNYNSSLGLALTFLLAGFALVSMYDCHRNLAGLSLLRAEAAPTFAQQHGELHFWFENRSALARDCLCLVAGDAPPTLFALAPGAVSEVRVAYRARTRGRQAIGRIELSSTAPLQLFRAWTWLHLPLTAVIYPRPRRWHALPPPLAAGAAGAGRRLLAVEEEWAWLRPFNVGDSTRRIAWKAYARGAPLLVAQYDAPAVQLRLLDFDTLTALPLEQKLSQLADWILECERRGEGYGLRLPRREIAAGSGAAQRQACLEALALFGFDGERAPP
jgi:uncharacterized protein (DUF58 family)